MSAYTTDITSTHTQSSRVLSEGTAANLSGRPGGAEYDRHGGIHILMVFGVRWLLRLAQTGSAGRPCD